jgi:putative transposase
VGPQYLKKKIEETYGIHIPHNRIYRILLFHGLAEITMRKRQPRNYVSMNEFIPCRYGRITGKITCYGIFVPPDTGNTITVLNRGFRKYGTRREILADHGTWFVSARDREPAQHKFKGFPDYPESTSSYE